MAPMRPGTNLLMLISRLRVLDEVDLVLQNEDVLQLHDFDGSQVLGRLRLRARLVSGWKTIEQTRSTSICAKTFVINQEVSDFQWEASLAIYLSISFLSYGLSYQSISHLPRGMTDS